MRIGKIWKDLESDAMITGSEELSDEIPYWGLHYHSYFCYGISSAGTGIAVNW